MDNISKTIYQDELFTFTTDDIYFLNNEQKTIFLDVSKYFNMYYLPVYQRVITTKNKFHKRKLIYLGRFFGDLNLNLNYKTYLPNQLDMSKLSTKYYQQKDFKFLPADAETTISMNIKDLFNLHPTYEINNIYYSIYKSGALKKIRRTDRKYRSSHHNMNLHKHIHNLQNKIRAFQSNTDIDIQQYQQTVNVIKKYCIIVNRYLPYHRITDDNEIRKELYSYKHLHLYKQVKQFTNITEAQYIENPLQNIMQYNLETLCNNSKYYTEIISRLYPQINFMNHKKLYKFVRMQYVLISLKRYDDAALLFLRTMDISYARNNSCIPDINDISKKTIDKYKKKFDSLYYQILKCKYTNNSSNDCTNINSFIIPKVREITNFMFKSYTELYKQQSPHRQNELFYVCNTNYNRCRTGIVSVKPKFL